MKDSIDVKNKNHLKKIYFFGFIIILLLSAVIFLNQKEISNKIYPHDDNKSKVELFAENNSDSENKIDVDMTKNKDDIKEINNLSYKIESSTRNTNPDILKIHNKFYYLFDEDILLPLDTKSWDEYIIQGDSSGKYDKIIEFYISGENKDNWTQNLTIHKINIEDKDCFSFTDKLVNGLIMNISNQLDALNIDLQEDNLSFNYVTKEANNTLMYWEKKGIANLPDETQFVRVFNSEYSNNMYLVTYTLKTNLNSLPNNDITNSMKVINSIQELKKKGN